MNDTNNVTVPICVDDIRIFSIQRLLNANVLTQTIGQNKQNNFVLLETYRNLIDELLAALIKENILTINMVHVGENIKLEVRLNVLKDNKLKDIIGAGLGHTMQVVRDKINNM